MILSTFRPFTALTATINAATGTGSIALGFNATAAANYALSLGSDSVASGYASVAVGGGSVDASGNVSAVFGLNATASGDHSEAFGWSLTNSTDFSLEIGYTDSYKLQISSAGFNFIGAGITLNSVIPWQTPLTAGTDYVTPTGDGSGLTGVVAASGWPTTLSGYPNDVGFLTSADMSSQSVNYANTAGSAGTAGALSGPIYGNQLVNTSNLQWVLDGDLQVGSVTASHFYGDASGLTMGIGGPALNVFPNASAPISSDPGTPGQMYFDDNYTYRCLATSDWRRNALNGGTGYITY